MFKTDLVERRIIGVANTYQLKEDLVWDDWEEIAIQASGTVDLTGVGSFTSGNIHWVKTGKQVTLTFDSCTHSERYNPAASAIIPAELRPVASASNATAAFPSTVRQLFISPNGSLSVYHRTWNGSSSSQTSFSGDIITYVST